MQSGSQSGLSPTSPCDWGEAEQRRQGSRGSSQEVRAESEPGTSLGGGSMCPDAGAEVRVGIEQAQTLQRAPMAGASWW